MNNPKEHLEDIKKTLSILAEELNSSNYTWLLGASTALMLHDINVVPNDIDVFVKEEQLTSVEQKLSQYLIEPTHTCVKNGETFKKFKLMINEIEVEIIELPKYRTTIENIEFNNQLIPVNSLKAEYEFYKSRPGKEATVKLIEEKLFEK